MKMMPKRSRGRAAASRAVTLTALAALLVLTAAASAFGRLVWLEGGAAFAPYTESVNASYGGRVLMGVDSASTDLLIMRDGTLVATPQPMAPYTESKRGPYGSDAASSGDSYNEEKAYEEYLHY